MSNNRTLEENRLIAAARPEHIPVYPPRSFGVHQAREGSAAKGAPREHPVPWPAFYDPPAFPDPPGQHGDELREQWRAWGQLWDLMSDPLFGLAPDHEVVGELFARLAHLVHLRVGFDPEFRRAMSLWAWSGYQVDVDWDRWDDDAV